MTAAVKDAAAGIRRHDAPMAAYIEDLYEASITYGAHPNPLSVIGRLEIEDGETHWIVKRTLAFDGTGWHVEHGLLACAEYGLAVAYLQWHAAPSSDDAVEVAEELQRVNELKNEQAERLTKLGQGEEG
jgi:hypothetical protein